ncbi:MAG: universal stress protein [Candidatus Kapabacteria bacterium]|jgi:nucleotide-binding universal stress UspA family protein|nr:universal stress protein [Candidatus Kapabacteria bacterium]
MLTKNAQILVPTDFSAPSNHALEYAETFAKAFDATLHLAHVIQEIEYTEEWGNVYTKLKEVREMVEEQSRQKLHALQERLTANGINSTLVIAHGRPDVVLKEYIEKHGISLVIIGTSGKRGVEHFVLGSTTERLLRSASCPVLAVRMKQHSS